MRFRTPHRRPVSRAGYLTPGRLAAWVLPGLVLLGLTGSGWLYRSQPARAGSPASSSPAIVQPAAVPVYSNSTPISIPASANGSPVATPYPSTITVAGRVGTVSKVRVRLKQLSHAAPQDLDIALGSERSNRAVWLMSDALGDSSHPVSNIGEITFEDGGAVVPQTGSLSAGGVYSPTNYNTGDDDSFSAPYNPLVYATLSEAFSGIDPNGVWQLFVTDDTPLNGFSGSIGGGWELEIVTSPNNFGSKSGDGQKVAITRNYSDTLKLQVRDDQNNPVQGASVTFQAPAVGASGIFTSTTNQVTVQTNQNGLAEVSLKANNVAGTFQVSAAVNGVSPVISTVFNLENLAVSLQVNSGSPQSVAVTGGYAPLVALVKDSQNKPLDNLTVQFNAPVAGARGVFAGNASTVTATTGANGLGSVSGFTAGTIAGSFVVSATLVGLPSVSPAQFGLTNLPGPPARISAVAGTPQSVVVSTTFGAGLTAQVEDQYDNRVPGVTVRFAAPSYGPSGVFTPANTISVTATTDGSGQVASGLFKAGVVAGSYQITATVNGFPALPPARFDLTNQPGPVEELISLSDTVLSAQVNTGYSPSFKVKVRDSFGNGVPNQPVNFIQITTTLAGGTFTGNAVQFSQSTDAAGEVSAPSFTASTTAGTYKVRAITTNNKFTDYTLTNRAGPPVEFQVVAGSGQSTPINTPYQSLKVQLRDTYNNPVSGAAVTFTGSNSPGQPGGYFVLSASPFTTATTFTVNSDSQGQATNTAALFYANTVAGSQVVTASVAGVAAQPSFALTNLAGSPAKIEYVAGSNQGTQINLAFGINLRVMVRDSFNNPVPDASVRFEILASSGAGGTFAGEPPPATTVILSTGPNGQATAPDLVANNTTGSYTARANVPGFTADKAIIFNLSNLNCANPFEVTSNTDNGYGDQCGTLSRAILAAKVANAATAGVSSGVVTITFASGLVSVTLTGPVLAFPEIGNNSNGIVVRVDGGCVGNNPGVAVVGGSGLTLAGNTSLSGLKLSGSSGYGLTATGKNNRLACNSLKGQLKAANGGQFKFVAGNTIRP